MRKLILSCTFIFLVAIASLPVSSFSNTSYSFPFVTIQPIFKADLTISLILFGQYTGNIYQVAKLSEAGLDSIVFKKAVTGFYNLQKLGKTASDAHILTIVDYCKSSCSKRMWIIDLKKRELMLNTWVAHGQGSGEDMACHFSNELSSYESSLGFYVTGMLYNGKHGRSLRLLGMDDGFNDKASLRSIVLHAAAYVSESSIHQLGRLGRSQGCPAVSFSVIRKVINLIKNQTVIFINGNDHSYSSRYLDESLAANFSLRDYTGNF